MADGVRRVGDHMTPTPLTIALDAELGEAVSVMRQHNIRHLPVVDGETLAGVVSDRDLALIESLLPQQWESVCVAEAMSPEPYSVSPEAPLWEVTRHMARNKFGCAVVMDGGRIVGVFTTIDALRLLSEVAHESVDSLLS